MLFNSFSSNHLSRAPTNHTTALAELGVDSVETVILSVNLSQSNATNHLDVIKPHWRELEEFVSRGVVYSLGISDLNLALLTALYDWAKVGVVRL